MQQLHSCATNLVFLHDATYILQVIICEHESNVPFHMRQEPFQLWITVK